MYKFLQSKKGFTLIELMAVIVLLSFGILTLANLFKVGYRAFDKSMERYQKQEAAKAVAVYLQNGSSALGGATKVELYDTLDVLPAEGVSEKGFAYIYVNPNDGFLYCRDKGDTTATQLSDEKLYITFSVVDDDPASPADNPETTTVDESKNADLSRAVSCKIAATEEEYTFPVKNGKLTPPTSDQIYYDLGVAYHFPNMIENSVLYVNRVLGNANDTSKTDLESYAGGYVRTYVVVPNLGTAGEVKDSSGNWIPNSIKTVDQNAILVRFVSDMNIEGEELLTENNVNLYCFIASASYGVNSGEGVVGLLCDFRDKVLLTNPLGEAFVKAYYKLSPPIAEVIADSEPLKAAVRVALKPLVVIAVNALNEDVAKESAPWFFAFMLCGAGSTAMLIRITKRRKKMAK